MTRRCMGILTVVEQAKYLNSVVMPDEENDEVGEADGTSSAEEAE